jgi:deazaflavin-dependent oxidoreductase (nitroreductase family)
MGISAWERALINRVVNPLMVALITHGLGPPTYAVVETTGGRTGRQRLVPVASGLDGDTFWLISGLGDRASYVHNIKANPHVRVRARPARVRDGLRMRWRAGTARVLPEDDACARHRLLGRGRPFYRLDGIMLRRLAAGGDMLTIRIDLDRTAATGHVEGDTREGPR